MSARALPHTTMDALRRALLRRGVDVADGLLEHCLAVLQAGLLDLLNPREIERDGVKVTEGFNPATAKEWIDAQLEKFSPAALTETGFVERALDVGTQVAHGAGRYVAQVSDAEAVEEYPAWELVRVYDRVVPRGDSGREGDDDWPTRWEAAAAESGDTDAASVLKETGRMIALKASPIWASLGSGAGGYTDTLGNPFPPFAFNSGYDVDEVTRKECEAIGLLTPAQRVPQPTVNPEEILAPLP